MIHADGSLRTKDMSLATVLILHGYHPVMERVSSGVEWTLPKNEVEEFVEDLLEEYRRGGCRVEPKRFIREFKQVREDLYKFLGVDGKPKRAQIRRTA